MTEYCTSTLATIFLFGHWARKLHTAEARGRAKLLLSGLLQTGLAGTYAYVPLYDFEAEDRTHACPEEKAMLQLPLFGELVDCTALVLCVPDLKQALARISLI